MDVLPPFWTLVETHGDELLVHARRLAGDEQAEDVLQDALLRALRAYPKLRHADHLRAWLYRVTTSAAMDHHRRAASARCATDDPPAVATYDALRRRRFESLIAPLNETARTALRLRFVDDLDYDGIAERARLLGGRRPPARLDRRPHPPGELRMTPLPESLLESVAAAAVREGLADAIFTRLNTPLGRLLVVQGPEGLVRIAFEGESEDHVLAEVAARARPERDRLRPRAGRRARRAVGVPRGRHDRARPARRPAADARRRSGARCSRSCARSRAGETVSYGELAARAGQPEGRARGRHGLRAQPDPDRRPLPPRAARHGQARQLRRRPGAQARAAGARGRASLLSSTVTDLMTTWAAGCAVFGSAWMSPIFVDDVHALGDLAQQRVVGRQRRGAVAGDDEELRARRARRARRAVLAIATTPFVVLEVARRRLLDASSPGRPCRRRPGRRPGSRSPGTIRWKVSAVEELLVGQVLERAAGDRRAAWRPA